MPGVQKHGLPSQRIRKALTEQQARVVERMLAGQGLKEAAEAEGVEPCNLWYWSRLGAAFEEIQREKLAARWESCRMMTMRLMWLGLTRLNSIIEKGRDADAVKAISVAIKVREAIAPDDFKFDLTWEQQSEQLLSRDACKDYWEEDAEEGKASDSGAPRGGAR